MWGFYLIIFGPLVRVKDLVYFPPSPLIHYKHWSNSKVSNFILPKVEDSQQLSSTLQNNRKFY